MRIPFLLPNRKLYALKPFIRSVIRFLSLLSINQDRVPLFRSIHEDQLEKKRKYLYRVLGWLMLRIEWVHVDDVHAAHKAEQRWQGFRSWMAMDGATFARCSRLKWSFASYKNAETWESCRDLKTCRARR